MPEPFVLDLQLNIYNYFNEPQNIGPSNNRLDNSYSFKLPETKNFQLKEVWESFFINGLELKKQKGSIMYHGTAGITI